MKKRMNVPALLCGILLFVGSVLPASAAMDVPKDMPYDSYIYNSDQEPVSIPAPYVADRSLSGQTMGVGAFQELCDVFYDGIDRLYFTDKVGNRVVITDSAYQSVTQLSTFVRDGEQDALLEPQGVFANGEKVYVADSGNSRIVVFDRTGQFLYALNRPEINVLGADYVYTPTALTVDGAGRLYVIADGINQGLICLSETGEFNSFLGAPSVEYDFFEIVYRRFATKAQRDQMQQYVPTEYSKLLMNDRGFIYAVAESSTETPVAKLNSEGNNVLMTLKNEGEYGNIAYTTALGDTVYPHYADVAIDASGSYYLLDSQSGQLFIYSDDGYLLFAFGAGGSQQGTFLSGSSIELVGDELLVADHIKNTVAIFKLTDFGRKVQQALMLYGNSQYDEAAAVWQEVYALSSNYTLAVEGLAKIAIQNGEYGEAMAMLEPIHAHATYSKAFEKWRDDFVRTYFGWLLVAIVALVVVVVVGKKFLPKLKPVAAVLQSDLYQKYRYGTYAMLHPFDGFWDIKRERRGNIASASLILGLFTLFYAIRTQFSGYVVTKTISSEVNALRETGLVLLLLVLWIVANWCFTALMDGEGSMKDIYIATCYALKPYVILSVPLFIMSHLLTDNEAVFYNVLDKVALIWVLALLFVGLMITHDYSLGKSILTTVLTIVGICLIIFILLLFVSIVQQVFSFFYDAYLELSFRTY